MSQELVAHDVTSLAAASTALDLAQSAQAAPAPSETAASEVWSVKRLQALLDAYDDALLRARFDKFAGAKNSTNQARMGNEALARRSMLCMCKGTQRRWRRSCPESTSIATWRFTMTSSV